jgi:hypothetical protein
VGERRYCSLSFRLAILVLGPVRRLPFLRCPEAELLLDIGDGGGILDEGTSEKVMLAVLRLKVPPEVEIEPREVLPDVPA